MNLVFKAQVDEKSSSPPATSSLFTFNSNSHDPLHLYPRVNLSLQLKHRPWVHLFCISSHESHVLGGVGFLLTIEEIEVGVKKGRVTFS